ncbi:hypothetical protein KQX54_011794 [Cotesia glomerata]|uniref:Uncharacterized protein n=1 Tax=Cotesia glomerata TaxID=32391 RepID=A0AAV7IU14_COTGL|nr:hypothetical protein KQX54_011794 [Cotesia glomerata]
MPTHDDHPTSKLALLSSSSSQDSVFIKEVILPIFYFDHIKYHKRAKSQSKPTFILFLCVRNPEHVSLNYKAIKHKLLYGLLDAFEGNPLRSMGIIKIAYTKRLIVSKNHQIVFFMTVTMTFFCSFAALAPATFYPLWILWEAKSYLPDKKEGRMRRSYAAETTLMPRRTRATSNFKKRGRRYLSD